ncbi:MAG: hypothetical protein K5672_04505 [Bacteroidaceae bacterium]|nr:hypothetical protein [Bacteroidaceae bacterium]
MKTKRMFQWVKVAALVMCLPLCVTSCTDSEEDEGQIEYLDPPQVESIEPCNSVTAFVSDMSSEKYSRVVDAMFPKRVTLEEAEIAVVTSAEIGSFDGKLFSVYERGGTIVVVKPDGRHYEEFADFYGLEKKMSEINFGEILAFAFNKDHRYYTLYDDTDEETHDEQHYIQKLNRLSEWLTELYQPAYTRSTFAANAAQTRSSDNPDFDMEYPDEKACFNIPVQLHYTIMKQASSDPDKHEKDGSIDVDLSVWYAYGNSGNKPKDQGDYYFAKCKVTAHNDDVWNPYRHRHCGVFSYIVGYFMREMQVSYKLENHHQGNVSFQEFISDPKPMTSVGEASYSHSEGWTLGGGLTLSGGFDQTNGGHAEASASFSFSHSWSNSSDKTLKDLTTENNSKDGQVKMRYIFNNLNKMGQKNFTDYGFSETNYTSVSRSNAELTSSCAWRVPIGTWGVEDNNNKTRFKIHLCIHPIYGTDHWEGGLGKKFHHDSWTNQRTYNNTGDSEFDFYLSAPNRTPYGILAVKNGYSTNESVVMTDVKVWPEGADPSKDTPIGSTTSSYNSEQVVKFTLNAGKKYTIRYNLYDTSYNPQKFKGLYEVTGIEIHTGNDEASATTEVSTVKGKKIE